MIHINILSNVAFALHGAGVAVTAFLAVIGVAVFGRFLFFGKQKTK